MRNKTEFFLALGLFLSLTVTVMAQSVTKDQANTYFQEQNWSEAAKAYEVLAKAEPNFGQGWFRLAYSLHAMGKYNEAIPAYQKCIAIGNNPIAMYDLACSYAKLNDKDKAFEWLKKAVSAGFTQVQQIKSDTDLETLRSDARFQEVINIATNTAAPCMAQPEYSQFDFWVGDWEVRNPQGQIVGSSSIQKVVNGCAILENWTSASGGTGKSLNYYNAAIGKWQQKWMGSNGSPIEFEGGYKDNAMQYWSVVVGTDGKKTLGRMTYSKMEGDKVRQLWEQSTDEGKTWTTAFDGIYSRKK